MWNKCADYIELPTPIRGEGFSIIGYFPYSTASCYTVCIPRKTVSRIEALLPHNVRDNKIVLICRDEVNFGTNNFALYLKDLFASFGRWEDVRGYGGGPLRTR